MCSNITTECHRDTIQGLGYVLLFVPGILLHIIAFRAFLSRLGSWTDTHIYIFNLALADCTLIIFLPFRIYDSFCCLPKTPLCTVLFSIHYLNMYASIMTTAAVSVHSKSIWNYSLKEYMEWKGQSD
ncbi:hypothetical protein WMY93_001486 [Mugilogobius chulae]|uniref:G-protein coupled receptors family 1 profile domain-containing protein n=1 Tax=Mugilogobius chulae TaxID=88201 RepID=A0AAW0Q3D0_9GOBI